MNSSQNDISCLNQKLELLKLELDLQKKEYVKHISFILEKSEIDSILIEEIETQDTARDYSFLESKDEGLAGDSTMDMPVFKNCAYLSRQKTVTIPSFQNNSFYVLDTDDLKEEEKSFQCYEVNYDDSICISKMDISSRSNIGTVDNSINQVC